MASLQPHANDAMEYMSRIMTHASQEQLKYDEIVQVIEGWKLVDA
jgi:hypothetical protein